MRNLLTGMLMIGLSSAGCLSKLSSPATNGATGDSSGTSGAAGTGSQTAAEVAGRSAMRRLTAAEWQNSVQSVLGTNITLDPLYQVADQLNVMDFPTDGSSQTIATGDLNTMYLQLEEAVTATFAQGTPALLTCTSTDAPGTAARTACTTTIVNAVLRQTTRRAVTAAQTSDFVALVDGEPVFTDGVKVMLQAAFLSPEHLFIRTADDGTSNYTLNSYELAERLAFFLWASPPDAELASHADAGDLTKSAVLSAEVTRMVADPKIQNFVTQFINGWLDYRLLPAEVRSTSLFPTFNTDGGNALFGYMSTETSTLLTDVFQNAKPIDTLLTANYTWTNGPLRTYYGLPAPTVDLPGFDNSPLDAATKRMGILSHGGLLTALSDGSQNNRVIHRGAFIMNKILCNPLAPPDDANVAAVTPLPVDTVDPVKTQLAAHVSDPACSGCHAQFDPLGIAMEDFDNAGAFRTAYPSGVAVDATDSWGPAGATPVAYDGIPGIAPLITATGEFRQCVAQNLAGYALGRPFLGTSEGTEVQTLVKALPADVDFTTLITTLVSSPIFSANRPGGAN